MAPPKASLLLAFLLLISGCLARQQQQQQQQQQNQCQLRRINPLQPTNIVQAEAGVTEFWNPYEQQLQCAGAEFIRHRIQPNGLLLPSYVNTPILAYVEQGNGVQGVVLPGCPETFESSQQQSQQFPGQERSRGPRFMDRHQKIQNLMQGDVAAIPAGAAHWIHNNGDRELVLVVFFDTQNDANQLDQNHRRFFLAGNPQAGRQQGQQGQQGQGQGQQQRQPQLNAGNIFRGFDTEFIAEAFNVDRQTAERLGGQQDQRGHIVNVPQGLEMVRPQYSAERQGQGQPGGRGSDNGFDETICATELRMNIDKLSRVDFANPQAGRLTNLNNYKFPILRLLQLSVQRGELHRDAMVAPHWTLNAHNVLYVTEGSMRMQIVNNEGQSVFDDEIRERQLVVIPQNFAVIKRAGQQGCRWVSFRTNDNAMVGTLAGRTSAIRAMPVDVVANAFQIPREQAQSLKFNQQETMLFSPRSSRRAVA